MVPRYIFYHGHCHQSGSYGKCFYAAFSYFCRQCSEVIQNYPETDINYTERRHCLDCEDWRKYVFCVSNSNTNSVCHCDVLKNDSIKNTFEEESKSMVKLENMVKKRCRAMQGIEESKSETPFWENGFLGIIDEFENAENGKLVQKNRCGKKQPRPIDGLKSNANYWKNQ